MAIWLNFAAILGYLTARYSGELPEGLYFLFSLAVGVGFVLLAAWLVYEVLHALYTLLKRVGIAKNSAFKGWLDALFLLGLMLWLGAAIAGGTAEPAVVKVRIDSGRLPKAYKIVQISDMHVGGLIGRDFVRRCVARINALKPDLVVITGDLTDRPVGQIAEDLKPLKALRSRFGTYYVPGNHEYFHGLQETLRYLKTLGIRVLDNRAVKIDDAFWLAGTYDYFGFRRGQFVPDITTTRATIGDNAPVLLLTHQPRMIEKLGSFRPDLILCGHTHGGQIWPFGYLVGLMQPFVSGLHPLGDKRYIYVNNGIGFWGPPMRLGSRTEIAVIEWK